MGWVAWKIEVHVVGFQEGAVEVIINIDATGDGVDACEDHDLWRWAGIIAELERTSHVLGDWAGNHNTIGMARTCDELDAVTTHVEVDVACSAKFPFSGVVAACADLTEFEAFAEEFFVNWVHWAELDRLVFTLFNDEIFADGCGKMIVLCKGNLAWKFTGTFAAKCAAAEIERDLALWVCSDGLERTCSLEGVDVDIGS